MQIRYAMNVFACSAVDVMIMRAYIISVCGSRLQVLKQKVESIVGQTEKVIECRKVTTMPTQRCVAIAAIGQTDLKCWLMCSAERRCKQVKVNASALRNENANCKLLQTAWM